MTGPEIRAGAAFADAVALHRAGRMDEAEALYRRAVTADPGNAEALHLAGVLAFQMKHAERASVRITAALAADPALAPAWRSLAVLLAARGDAPAAAARFRRAATLDPGDADLHYDLARSLQAIGRHGEAERAYTAALALRPDHIDARYRLGMIYADAGQPDLAAPHLGEVVVRAPGHAAAWRALALALTTLRHPDAELALRRARSDAPGDPDLNTRLGHLLLESGRHAAAEPALRTAAAAAPDRPRLLFALGSVLQAQGKLAEAVAVFRRCLTLDGGYGAALNNLGIALFGLHRPAVAEAVLRRALVLRPDDATALNNLGTGLEDARHLDDAGVAYGRAVRLRPDHARAVNNLGSIHAARKRSRPAEALRRRAVALQPDFADAWANLGLIHQGRDRLDAAERLQRRALRLNPGHVQALTNLGLVMQIHGRFEEAERLHRMAVTVEPAYADALANLGLARWSRTSAPDAETPMVRALRLDAGQAVARFNRGLIRLSLGDLEAGWRDYQWRFRSRGYVDRAIDAPLWDEPSAAGRTLLVWREQGVGDELMFASCYADAAARAGRTVIECDARLVSLFARSFPEATVRPESAGADGRETIILPDCDVQVPAGRLPMLVRERLGDFPSRPAWLVPDPVRLAAWRERLAAAGPGLKVGIGWRSSRMTTDRRRAYTRLDQWGPLFAIPGVVYVNLQYDDCAAEIADAEARFGVRIHRWADVDLKDDFEAAAALMANLDLVISPAMSAGELAGALGVPVWRFGAADWTWLGTGVRPWFPSMRVFAPRPGEGLVEVLARMAAELRRLARPPESPPPLPPPDPAAVAEAVALYRAGDAAAAERSVRAVLETQPDHPVAHHLLAVLLKRRGDAAAAADHFGRAAAGDPGTAAAHAGMAGALQALGRLPAAAAAAANAVAAEPDGAEHWHNRGALLALLGEPEAAAWCARRAVLLKPYLAPAHSRLGTLAAGRGDAAAAAAGHRRALAVDPALVEAHVNLGATHNGAERYAAAEASLRRALVLDDRSAAAWTNLGSACAAGGRAVEAEACHRRALALDGASPDAHANLGHLLRRIGRAAEAEDAYRAALTLAPRHAGAHYNLAHLLLERGALREGWAEHDWRFATDQFRGQGRRLAARPWRGGNLAAARLLVWREQGVGDEVMFASCYADLTARARGVVIECDRRLVSLFARSFPGATVRPVSADPRDADAQVPAGTLPRYLRGDLARFPTRPAWLVPDPARVAAWRERLTAAGPGLKVGIGWRSGLMTQERSRAYIRLDAWGPLFAVPGVEWVNLQYDDCAAEIADAEARFGVRIHRWTDVDLKDDFEAAAALMANLDLVISPAMSAGELAGALGVPVWRFGAADWTWLGTGVRPWFPSMRVFAPGPGEGLADVPARMAAALRRLSHPPVPVPPDGDPQTDRMLEEAAEHHRHGRRDAAADLYARVLDRRPGDPVALHLSGLLAHQGGDHGGAVDRITAALARRPDFAAARVSLGCALLALGRPAAAAAALGRALALRPDDAAALTNLGNALEACHALDAAALCHHRALATDPGLAAASDNLGAVLLRLDRAAEAEVLHRAALVRDRGLVAAWVNLGVALRRLGRREGAFAACRRALALAPDLADALANLGRLHREDRRAAAAERWCGRALTVDPDHAAAHFTLGMLRLAAGDTAAGWAGYDHRFRARALAGAVRPIDAPPWQGEDLTGRSILVWREQGVGDEILFASCLPDLIARAGRVVVECDPRLVPLFARSFPAADVHGAATHGGPASGVRVDWHAAAGSLPRRLRPGPGAFPAGAGYLRPDPGCVASWRDRLAALAPGLRVGIAWRSGLMTPDRLDAYTALADWGAVFAVPGVVFVSLQYGDCAAELRAAEKTYGVSVHRWDDLDLKDDLEGVAALVANLDLVLTPATAVGELAGALGVPVWRFAGAGDWSALGQAVRPWFPSMRLFTPGRGEPLPAALVAMARCLSALRP
ncbi:tetratricopeptide repeat protein [Azospirillum halopraeferens]|uniref:tetratricopeptide repeat protein n=1 Tax=Azospirillum halopraeferens TaxID=34010 RepID=UPI000419CE40|nr:tetratricopeptide repeat protein [Azospirillum halopraeferens]